jgi:hypothetical protein
MQSRPRDTFFLVLCFYWPVIFFLNASNVGLDAEAGTPDGVGRGPISYKAHKRQGETIERLFHSALSHPDGNGVICTVGPGATSS